MPLGSNRAEKTVYNLLEFSTAYPSPFNIVTFCAVKLAINASFSRWYGVHPG